MLSFASLFRLLATLIATSILATTYLYLYPLFHRCAFPTPTDGHGPAPFRLLALADPQLEGDTSFPPRPVLENLSSEEVLAHLRSYDGGSVLQDLRSFARNVETIVRYQLEYGRKALDLLGNDFYLSHIYRTLHWWSDPTHATVLGDLLGSQWIKDDEFSSRSRRYWQRVFKGAERVPTELLDANFTGTYIRRSEVLGSDPAWSRRLINVVGNHDIGYAGDIVEERIERFEKAFGPVNGDILFTLPRDAAEDAAPDDQPFPGIRVIVLNSMNLDSPAISHELQGNTVRFINAAIEASAPVEDNDIVTILLTHIPLHKESGICVDDPFFSYFGEDHGSGVQEQNMLSEGSSQNGILQGLFGKSPDEDAPANGLGRNGIILTGHDHEGCDVYHYADRETTSWKAQRWGNGSTATLAAAADIPGIREVTLRSMMGDYGGNAVLLSAWWEPNPGRWKMEVSRCMLGVQHIWWAVHILDLITLAFCILAGLACTCRFFAKGERPKKGSRGNGRPTKTRMRESVKRRDASKT
jgi:hypothetical protein